MQASTITTTQPLIRVEQLSKTYERENKPIHVLKDLDLTIQAGEMVAITGKSGAGKSTLLHLLGSLDTPDRGAIYYAGQDLAQLSPPALADFRNQELGFVFQFHYLLPEFTALENVMLPALIKRYSAPTARQLATNALTRVELKERLAHKPAELSGGEQQRVALARALVLTPKLLLADEVTGNLDERTGAEIHDLLFALNAELHITMVIVTHNKSLADRMPRCLLLEHGLIKEKL